MTYEEIINNTIVPETLSKEEQRVIYNRFVKYINAELPRKLYRFRSCTKRSLDALYNDELWFSNGREMNDDFDARLYYDKQKIEEWIQSLADSEGNLIAVMKLFRMNSVPEEIKRQIPNGEYLFQMLKMMPMESIRNISSNLIQMLLDNLDSELMRTTEDIQGKTKFACFTEKIYSDMMWGHYANNATGFAVEYEFGEACNLMCEPGNDNQSSVICNLVPILYGNRRIDGTEYAKYFFQVNVLKQRMISNGIQVQQQWLNTVVPCPDLFMATKVAINKSSDWESEKEWRMFYISNDMATATEKYTAVKMKPSAIYMGRKISDINQKIVMDIAREKAIPVYKMDINESLDTYKLIATRL